MDTIKGKMAFLADKKWRTRVIAISAALLACLIAGLCISIHMQSNIRSKYSSAAAQLETQLYEQLCGLTQTFDYIGNPNVNVQYTLIPELNEKYAAVSALNTALRDGFGKKYAVLSDELTAAFDTAFEEFETAFREGSATGLAEADMRACMDEIQILINEYYDIREPEEVETLGVPN